MGTTYLPSKQESQQRRQSTLIQWEMLNQLTVPQKLEVIKGLFNSLEKKNKLACCSDILWTENIEHETIKFIDEAFLQLAIKNGIVSNPRHFASISMKAMQRLQMEKKPNLVYKFAEMLTLQKYGSPMEPVIQLGRMPFGLIEYVIQFFVTPNVTQVAYCHNIYLLNFFIDILTH